MTDKDKKRLALRFLKEIGFLEAWKLYTKKEKINKKWYNKAFVDKIFGDSNFTYFLKIKYSIFLRTTITGLFRYYLIEIKEIGPIVMFNASYPPSAPLDYFKLKHHIYEHK
jgi:hypothetical protein